MMMYAAASKLLLLLLLSEMLLEMDSVEVSHKTLFIFEVESVLQGDGHVAELPSEVPYRGEDEGQGGRRHVQKRPCQCHKNEIKNKSYEDIRIY